MFKLLNSVLWMVFILLLINGFVTGHWRYIRYPNGPVQKALFVVAPGAHLWVDKQENPNKTYWQVSPWQEYQEK